MSQNEIPEIKLILLGEMAVGKTSIIKRYYENSFNESEASSLTMSYVDKLIEINGYQYKLNIWDTIGQEQYRSISKLFLNDAKIVILVYSIDNKKSFEELDFWYNLYKEELGNDGVLGICGNKIDKYLEQEVTTEEGENYAKKRNAFFAEISAKEDKKAIDRFILNLVSIYYNKTKGIVINDKKGVKLEQNDNKNENGGGCCSSKNEKNK